MQTIKIIKQCEHEKGKILQVENNEAHRLIDGGWAKLYNHKMMKPSKKGYKIK